MRAVAVLLTTLTASVLAPQAVFASEDPPEPPPRTHFGPLTFDLMLAGGLSSELYLHAEPSFDLGIVRLGETGGVGIGGGIDVGICALCGLVSVLSDVSWKGSYVAPFFRSTVHAGRLGGLIPERDAGAFDLFIGALVGPSFYSFTASAGGSTFEEERVTVRFAPLIGLRIGFANNRLLLFAEYHYNIEGGFSAVTYTNAEGEEQVVAPDTVNRRGNEFIFGIGTRF